MVKIGVWLTQCNPNKYPGHVEQTWAVINMYSSLLMHKLICTYGVCILWFRVSNIKWRISKSSKGDP